MFCKLLSQTQAHSLVVFGIVSLVIVVFEELLEPPCLLLSLQLLHAVLLLLAVELLLLLVLPCLPVL